MGGIYIYRVELGGGANNPITLKGFGDAVSETLYLAEGRDIWDQKAGRVSLVYFHKFLTGLGRDLGPAKTGKKRKRTPKAHPHVG